MTGEKQGYLAHMTFNSTQSTSTAQTKIARLTNCSIAVTHDLIEISNRDSTGPYREHLAGFKQWSGSAEFIFADANAIQEELYNAMVNRAVGNFTFYPGGSTAGGSNWAGDGYITNWEATAPNEEAVAHSIEIQGTGALSLST